MAESFLCLKKKLDEVQAFEKERLTKLVLLTRDAITEMKEKLTKVSFVNITFLKSLSLIAGFNNFFYVWHSCVILRSNFIRIPCILI